MSDPSYLWIPRAPTNTRLTLSSLSPDHIRVPLLPFEPLVDIDFGGLQGERLGSLTRIVAHMVAKSQPITGLEFFYLDGSIMFGCRGHCEISFLIDGPGGERITDAKVLIYDYYTPEYINPLPYGGLQVRILPYPC